MFKLLANIKNIKASSFKIEEINNFLYINKDDSVILFDGLNIKEPFKEANKLMVSLIVEDEVWIANLSNGKTKIYKCQNVIEEVNFIATTPRKINLFLTKSNIITHTYFNGDFSNRYYTIINKISKSIVRKYENLGFNGIYQVINDNLFLSQNNEKFGVFTFENQCVWECYYKNLFKDYEPIGAGTTNILKVGNKLYVELDKTYCIDIETGKTEQVYNYKFTKSENEFLYGLQFLSMTEFHLAILNTKTNTIKMIDVSEALNKLNVYPDNRIVVKDGLVYFSQNMGDSIAKFGILDPNSGKILWKYDFESKNGYLMTLKVNGNRIYAHTQDKTLHIFEKQDNEII